MLACGGDKYVAIKDFEVEALARVTGLLPKDSVVTVPVVHRFDREAHAIIMNDSGEGSVSLKKLMLENVPPLELADQIGRALGEFLGHLHIWGRTNDAILDIFDANKQARTTTMTVFYGRLITTLTGKDALPMLNEPPMNVPEGHLEIISRLVSERSLAIQSSRETFTMGDFWPGNIM
jgi:5-methylthioribose kinase